MNYHYQPQNEHNPNNPQRPESERDRRIRLREAERLRRNQGIDEGLKYGAMQMMPPQPIKHQQQVQVFPGQQQYLGDSLNDRDQPQMLQAINQNQLVRKSSKSKLDLQSAQELDKSLNNNNGILAIGQNNLDDYRRELDRQQKQQEYQRYLSQQNPSVGGLPQSQSQVANQAIQQNYAEQYNQIPQQQIQYQIPQKMPQQPVGSLQIPQQPIQMQQQQMPSQGQLLVPQLPPQAPQPQGSPNRMKERLNSARKLSIQIEEQQSQQRVKSTRNASRGSEGPTSTNILGQPMQISSQRGLRSGSTSRLMPDQQPLVVGGLNQIGDQQKKIQEDKIKRQREYREYLDMQRAQKGGAPSKPPMPSPGNNKQTIMDQSKSNWDQGYLQERRKQIADEVFENVARKTGSQMKFQTEPQIQNNQNLQPNSQQIDYRNEAQLLHQNQQDYSQGIQNQMSQKQKYAQELQAQIDQKRQLQKNSSRISEQAQPQPQVAPEIQHQAQQEQINYQPQQQQQPEWRANMEKDPMFLEILARKKEELRREMEMKQQQSIQPQELAQFQQAEAVNRPIQPAEMQPQMYQPFQIQNQLPPQPQYQEQLPPRPQQEMRPPIPQYQQRPPLPEPIQEMPAQAAYQSAPEPSSIDPQRQRQDEYRKQLQEQIDRKKDFESQRSKDVQQMQEKFMKPDQNSHIQSALPTGQNFYPNQNAGLKRSDITSEKQESQAALDKRAQYQEELRQQVELAKRKKEEEKQRRKQEDELMEMQLQKQRDALQEKEKNEMRKEGKNVDEAPKGRKIDRSQFETSDQIAERQKQEANQERPEVMREPEQAPAQPPYQPLHERVPEPEEVPAYQPLNIRELAAARAQVQAPAPQQLPTNYQPQFEPQPPQRPSHPSNVSMQSDQYDVHQKLLVDQKNIIEMYQSAFKHILDMRQSIMQESQAMMLPQQQPQIFAQDAQRREIDQLKTVQNTLANLMGRVIQGPQSDSQLTSIINPAVQNNLNDLIKTQRDKIVRMSQTVSFKEPSPDKQETSLPDIPQSQFDQSLDSKSKLIAMPKQFQNNLQEKAKNIELERLQQTPHQPTVTKQNQYQNTSVNFQEQWDPENRSRSPHRSNMYQTWKPGNQANDSQSINQRDSMSPSNQMQQPYLINNSFQASLIGSSQFQYQNLPQSPNHNAQLSPNSRAAAMQFVQNEPIQEEGIQEDLENTQDQQEINLALEDKQEQEMDYHPQSEQVKVGGRLMKQMTNTQTVETHENDLNTRDEISDYTQQAFGRKSKGSNISKNLADNMAFIDSKLNSQPQFNQIGSPNNYTQSRENPTTAKRPPITMHTDKSFYKQEQVSIMHQTGMQQAKQTGSSFYNQTMAKTQQQKLKQENAYREQIAKIMSSEVYGEETPRSDPNDARNVDKDENEDQKDGKYQLPMDDTDYYEHASNINIAQSVAGSMDISQPPYMGTGIQQRIGRTSNELNKSSNIIDQQYNWIMHENNVINEQQELEHSKSKSRSDQESNKDLNFKKFTSASVKTAKEDEVEEIIDAASQVINDETSRQNVKTETIRSSIPYQFEGTQSSATRDFKVNNVDENTVRKSNRNRPWEIKTSQHISEAVPYQITQEEEEPAVSSMVSLKHNVNHDRNVSDISGLKLDIGLTSDPTTPMLIAKDQSLKNINNFDPNLPNLKSIESDPNENERLDQLYAVRQSQQAIDEFLKKEASPQRLDDLKPLDERTSDIYPPKRPAFQDYQNQKSRTNQQHQILSVLKTRSVDPLLDETPQPTPPNIASPQADQKQAPFMIPEDEQEHQPVSGLETKQIDQMTPSHQKLPEGNTSESYAQRIEKDFEDSMRFKEKAIDDIFQVNQSQQESRQKTPPRESNLAPPTLSRLSRPQTNITQSEKYQQLDDLQRLIQEATGNVNNIVESSQQFMQTRQANRLKKGFFPNSKSPREIQTDQVQKQQSTIEQMVEPSPFEMADQISASQITQQAFQPNKVEEKPADQMMNQLDALINNLESMKVQTKFSSNRAFVTGTFPGQSPVETPKLGEPHVVETYELPIDEESGQTQQIEHSKRIDADSKQAVILDDSKPFRLGTGNSQNRPISGKSNQNRYTPGMQASRKKNDYQQFDEDDDEDQQ